MVVVDRGGGGGSEVVMVVFEFFLNELIVKLASKGILVISLLTNRIYLTPLVSWTDLATSFGM